MNFYNNGLENLRLLSIEVFLDSDSESPHMSRAKTLSLQVMSEKLNWSRDTDENQLNGN